MSQGLDNIRVLITRPLEQSQQLSALIEAAGGIAVSLPMLAIEPHVDAESKQRCQFVTGYDWVIFISQNAVRHVLSLLPLNNWMDNTAIAAIGRSTTNALRQAGFSVALQPDKDMNSEGLLEAFSAESLIDKKILIIRGEGGREALAEGLRKRGALVDYAEVYRRYCPRVETEQLSELLSGGIDVLTIASGETLQNLRSIINLSGLSETQQKELMDCPLIVVSNRIRDLAKKMGLAATVIVAKQPDNDGIVKAIQAWRRGDNE